MPSKINKQVLIGSLFILSCIAGCSHQPWSTRDINQDERAGITEYSKVNEREPADWRDECIDLVRGLIRAKPKPTVAQVPAIKTLPELTQLNPEIKKFPNGKKYIEYRANVEIMNNNPDYEEFLERTAEVVFEPVAPFGHIKLRIGKNIYSFNFIQQTSIGKYYPRIKNSSSKDLPGSEGYIFELDKDKIIALEKEVAAFYNSSSDNNVPPFDAYSPLLKIHEEDGTLMFKSDSPKYGNENEINGKIINEDGRYYLAVEDGIKVDVIKKGDDYYTQSYSCSSSAGHILQKFFGIELSYAYSAKSLQQSLSQGNINQNLSPIGVMKYHEEK